MSYRFMRILVMFDLPVVSGKDRREYARFRKYLIKSGFAMLQESVYTKLVLNAQAGDAVIDNLYRNKPENGLVQALRITEKQYSGMELIVGESKSDVVDTDERIVYL